MKNRSLVLLCYAFLVSLLAACSDADAPLSAQTSEGSPARVVEKAVGDPVPVHRFAKISNGAYFYTANQTEFEDVVANYPDFRYEGVAFQAAATGGTPVFRYAKIDTGAYFYTTSVEEKAIIAASYPNFRYEGEVFNVPTSAGAPMYRLANISNGAYLYTASLEEYNYAQTVGFRGEGEKFQVPAGLLLSGTVFKDAAWKQAKVQVVDVNRVIRTTTTNALGGYSVDITGLTAPIFVVASYKSPGSISDYMLAGLPSLPANATATTANVTPLSHLVLSYANPADLTGILGVSRVLPAPALDLANKAVRQTLSQQLTLNGLQSSDFDSTKLPFAANQTGQAALLRDITVEMVGYQGKAWITNNLIGDGPNSSVLLQTSAIAAGTTPTLPLATKAAFPSAKLVALKQAWNACLAISAASRITVLNGLVTSVHPTCAAVAAPGYLFSGESFGERWKSLLGEPSFVSGSVEDVTFRSYSDLDGKELAGVYVRALSNNGKPFNSLEVFRKINGSWEVAGNDRPYIGAMHARYTRYIRFASAAAGNVERYRTDIQFLANPGHPSMANIRAVRVRGPGLPTAGLVYTRSLVCGTAEYMTIENRDGLVADSATGAEKIWTENGSPTFNLSQLFTRGSGTWTAGRNFADTNLLAPEEIISPRSTFTIDYFAFGSGPSATPFATYNTVLSGTVINARAVRVFTDGLMNVRSVYPDIFDEFLSMTANAGANAGQRTTVPVTGLVGEFAGGVTSIFGNSSARNAAQTDSTKADFLFVAQGGSAPWLPYNTNSSTVTFDANDLPNGVSTHPTTQTAAGALNTTCSTMPAAFRGLNELNGYREMTFRSTAPNFTRFQSVFGLQN